MQELLQHHLLEPHDTLLSALNLFTRTGYEGNFALNGNSSLIPASAFHGLFLVHLEDLMKKLIILPLLFCLGLTIKVTNTGDVFQ